MTTLNEKRESPSVYNSSRGEEEFTCFSFVNFFMLALDNHHCQDEPNVCATFFVTIRVNFDLLVVLDRKSGDHQTHSDSSPGEHGYQ